MEIQRTASNETSAVSVALRKRAPAPALPLPTGRVPGPEVKRARPANAEEMRELNARIAQQLNTWLKESGRDLEFRIDAGAGTTVTTIRRADTGEVVRQFPTEEALAWMRRLNAQSGTFLDESA